jgi:uncharacterized protein YhjY with autotransporter beta-barrel domain
LLGAGTLNNAGTISIARTELVSAPGTTFVGTGDSLLEMDVFLDGTGQTGCSAISVAGCFDLSGGMTAGQSAIRVILDPTEDLGGPLRTATSANPGIVLVDVRGGTSHASHFVLDPGSDNYATDSVYGAVLDMDSVLHYALLYNPGTQQHLLASVPGKEAVEYATFIQQALSIWHTTSDAVAGRQADLRDGAVGGGWVRIVGERTSRDAAITSTIHGNRFTYDRGYSLNTGGIVGGFDLSADDNHAFGVHLGVLSASLEYDDSSTDDKSEGVTAGLYGGLWSDSGLSLDATVNLNMLDLEHLVSGEFEDSKTNMVTLGWRMEAGWRLDLSESLYLQPLATVAYAKADIEDLDLKDNDLSFEDAESLRGAFGARLGGETMVDESARIDYWIVARAWEEYRDEGHVAFATSGEPLIIEDNLSGRFDELGFGASLSTSDDLLTVFASGSMKSGDDVDSYNLTLGARMHW